MIQMILGTDMTFHFETLGQMKTLVASNGKDLLPWDDHKVGLRGAVAGVGSGPGVACARLALLVVGSSLFDSSCLRILIERNILVENDGYVWGRGIGLQ